jgi:hypothetical protein
MWKRSRLRAKRKIPESMPTSASATIIFARGQPHLPLSRHGSLSSRVPVPLTNGPTMYARNSLGEMLTESSILVATGYIQRNGKVSVGREYEERWR